MKAGLARIAAEYAPRPDAVVVLLLETVLTAQSDATKKALADFLVLGQPGAGDQAALRSYRRRHKVALLVKTFGMTTEELTYLTTRGADFENLDLNRLPLDEPLTPSEVVPLFRQWERMHELYAVKQSLPPMETTLLDVFAETIMTDLTKPVQLCCGFPCTVLDDDGADACFRASTSRCIILRKNGVAKHYSSWSWGVWGQREALSKRLWSGGMGAQQRLPARITSRYVEIDHGR